VLTAGIINRKGRQHANTLAANAQAFEEASGKQCKYKVVPRRGGDATAVWAATETAEKVTACESICMQFSGSPASFAPGGRGSTPGPTVRCAFSAERTSIRQPCTSFGLNGEGVSGGKCGRR